MTHNVLFVCGKNRLRSPTAKQVFANWPGVETASAGTSHDADCPVSAELIGWADSVLVMEASHRAKIAVRFQPQLRGKRVAVLGIPDQYEYMAPELVQLLQEKVPRYLPARAGEQSETKETKGTEVISPL
ncbi:low molecular weight protein tyrosine phosphatase family protein [Luteimonas sp. SDU101]|uniref:low molecular weight protein tyrosine phosphatase family protein n=1 Tax=Luteimonas sp. SDU101 TaxID=3422593 RepID=UPI003EBE7376